MSDDPQPAAPVSGSGILKFLLSRKEQVAKVLGWTGTVIVRIVAGLILFAPPILVALAAYPHGAAGPAVWDVLADYVEVYGLIGITFIFGSIVIGKFDEVSRVHDFQSYINSLILATIVALIHYQPVLTAHK